MAGLIVFGVIGLSRLGISQMPDVDFPQVYVALTLEGASPETMENDVVERVEDACMSVEGITDITSTSQQGRATVTVEFEVGRDIDPALQEAQTKVAQAQRRLPRGPRPAGHLQVEPRGPADHVGGRLGPALAARSSPTSPATACASGSRPSPASARSPSAATASATCASGSTPRASTRRA